MTLYEYKMLSEDDQWDTVFSKGRYLDMVIEGNSKFVLYAIGKFFVEVEWNIKLTRLLIRESLNAVIPWIGILMFRRRFEC